MPLLSLLLLLLLLPLAVAASPAPVTVLTIDGPITPASAAYFSQGLKRSVESGSSLIVLKLDTPGGLDVSMRDIIKEILASPIPVATFVHPKRTRRQCRHVHPVCEPHRRDGARHDPCRNAGTDRHRTPGRGTRAASGQSARKRSLRATRNLHRRNDEVR